MLFKHFVRSDRISNNTPRSTVARTAILQSPEYPADCISESSDYLVLSDKVILVDLDDKGGTRIFHIAENFQFLGGEVTDSYTQR